MPRIAIYRAANLGLICAMGLVTVALTALPIVAAEIETRSVPSAQTPIADGPVRGPVHTGIVGTAEGERDI